MKNKILYLLLMAVTTGSFYSCNEENLADSTPITVSAVYLEDADSDVPDRVVEYARLGWLLRLEGSGFKGMRTIYINGYETYFNPVLVSDNSMLVSVSSKTPVADADSTVRNTIRLVKLGTEYKFHFEIRDAAPSITSISHTLPQAGERITIYGSGLTEVSKIIFPGNVEVTENIICDEEDGEYCTVSVPAGLTQSGYITIEGPNGGAYSYDNFNYQSNVLLNFDGTGEQGYWGWSEDGSMINANDLEDASIGIGHVSQGKYCAHRPTRLDSLAQGKNRQTEVWTSGSGSTDDWRTLLAESIPVDNLVSEVAFQFDIYVPNEWTNTGFLKICLMNNFNGGEWSKECYNYVPWIKDGAISAFQTDGWKTVTIPFSQFYAFSDSEEYTFENVLAARESAEWKNFGMMLENSDFTLDGVEYTSSISTVRIYTDNWRIVPNTKPEYSDFPTTDE